MKRLLIIPILIIFYIFFINTISQMSFFSSTLLNLSGGNGQAIGLGQSIQVSVRRPYLFGLFYLPTYSESFGYIGGYHDAFFAFIVILTISLIILEFKNRKEIKGRKSKSKEEMNMAKGVDFLKYIKILVYGIIFSIVAFVLSGDTSSIALGLLVMYLEYKFMKR